VHAPLCSPPDYPVDVCAPAGRPRSCLDEEHSPGVLPRAWLCHVRLCHVRLCHVRMNTSYAHAQGVQVGDWWKDRLDCRQWGAHLPHVAGIAGQSHTGAQVRCRVSRRACPRTAPLLAVARTLLLLLAPGLRAGRALQWCRSPCSSAGTVAHGRLAGDGEPHELHEGAQRRGVCILPVCPAVCALSALLHEGARPNVCSAGAN